MPTMLINEAKRLQELANVSAHSESEHINAINEIIKKLQEIDAWKYSGVTPHLKEAVRALQKLDTYDD